MNKLNRNLTFFFGILLFGQQNVFADDHRTHGFRSNADRHNSKRGLIGRAQPKPQKSYSPETRRSPPKLSHYHYYRPGHQIKTLPWGHSKARIRNKKYFFYEGFFYLPSNLGYIIVDAPIGAIVATLPRLHQIFYWANQPYFYANNTYYRRHPNGYVVVPNPGFSHRR